MVFSLDFFFFKEFHIYLFIYFWLCWVFGSVRGLSLVAASGAHSSSRCAGLSRSRPLSLRSTGSRRAGSVVVAHGLSCSAACGIFPDQGSNPCALHWQADSQPLRHQGSPGFFFNSAKLETLSIPSWEGMYLIYSVTQNWYIGDYLLMWSKQSRFLAKGKWLIWLNYTQVRRSNLLHSWKSAYNLELAPSGLRFLCIPDAESENWTNCRLCSIIVFTVEKNPHVSGPAQFKPMLFNFCWVLIQE